MKLSNKTPLTQEIIKILVEHFEYSILDISSYDELTTREKEIIPEDVWNSITTNN